MKSRLKKNELEKQSIELMNYIRENYKEITLKDMADYFGFSIPYLSKYIKQKTGETFGNLVKNTRMKKACYLLKSTNLLVEDIAGTVGYQTVEHFNRTFKKCYHVTPVQYRNGKREKDEKGKIS